MKAYQDFKWSEGETLSNGNKQMLIRRLQPQHGFVVSALGISLLMSPTAYLAKQRYDLSLNGALFYLLILAVLAIVISYNGVKGGKERAEKIQANDFVWRYGTVTRTPKSRGYKLKRSEVDGQSVTYIFEASEGDTVFVLGFDTVHDAKTKASFYAVSVNS